MSGVSDSRVLSDSSSKSQCLTRALRLSFFLPSCLFYVGFGFLLWWRESTERDNDGEKEGNIKRNVRNIKRYYKERGVKR